MAFGPKRRATCVDQTTLATEIAEGAGKCMPTFAKTRDDTGRLACGPDRSWPPDRVTSRMTMNLPPVDYGAIKARLICRAPMQVPPNPTALIMKRPTPSQRKKEATPGQPWIEPLVRAL